MKTGDIVKCKVDKIFHTHFVVSLPDNWVGLVHVSKISDYYVTDIKKMFKVGEKYWFEIEEIDNENKRVKLSWKKIMPRFVKDPFEFEIKETKKGFTNLKEYINKEIESD